LARLKLVAPLPNTEEIYNRDLTDGNFTISDLSLETTSDTISITEAKIIFNDVEYFADIVTDGNDQTLTFLDNTPVTVFNVNEMKDYDTRNYIYTFILTTSELETHNVHRKITYILIDIAMWVMLMVMGRLIF